MWAYLATESGEASERDGETATGEENPVRPGDAGGGPGASGGGTSYPPPNSQSVANNCP